MIGKEVGQSKSNYDDNAGIVYGLFLDSKIKNCVVINEFGVLSQKTDFRGCKQIARVVFKDFLDLEKVKTRCKMTKLIWKRELYGVKIHHRIIGR